MMTILKPHVDYLTKTEFEDFREGDFKEVKTDISILKSDVGILKNDVSVLKEDVKLLKHDVLDLKKEVESIIPRVKKEFQAHSDSMNKTYREDLRTAMELVPGVDQEKVKSLFKKGKF